MKGTPEIYISQYADYVMSALDKFEPRFYNDTFEGALLWIKSFTQMLKDYNQAIEEKARELLQEVKRNSKLNHDELKARMLETKKAGIQAFLKKHR